MEQKTYEIHEGMIRSELPVADVRISYVGSVIGAHTGPGVIAIFCMGEGRTPKK